MVENKKYKALKDKQSSNKPGQFDNVPNADFPVTIEKELCKKHGVWCRIKTRLHLKKRTKKKHNVNASAGLYQDDKACLIATTSKESLLDENEEYTYKGKGVHVAYVSDKYRPLREVEEDFAEMENFRVGEGLSENDYYSPDDKDAILGKENPNKTLKELLSKKWHGKKAKRVRKGIRSGTRSSIKYLQTGTMNIHTLFPDATTLVGAFSRQQRPV